MGTHKNRRKSPRVPVYIDVSCKLACGAHLKGKIIDLSEGGFFIKVTETVGLKERLTVEFRLPDIPAPMQLEGKVVWSRSYFNKANRSGIVHIMGVTFMNIKETHRRRIQKYILEAIDMDSEVRSLGIVQVMSNIRKLPPAVRLKSYDLLIQGGCSFLGALLLGGQ